MYIDVNCSVGSWPFRPLPISDVIGLKDHFLKESVEYALVSSFEALFFADTYDVNRRLIDAIAGVDSLSAVPVINPRMRRWEADLASYNRETELLAVKLHLNYHSVPLDSGVLDDVAGAAAELKVILLLPLRIEDERLHHVRAQVPQVPLRWATEFAANHPETKFVILNAYRNELREIELPSNVYSDIAFAEYYKTIEDLLDYVSVDRILYGSNTPLFVTRAATMKVAWAKIDDNRREAIASGNAEKLLASTGKR